MDKYLKFQRKSVPLIIIFGIIFIISLACKVTFVICENNNIYLFTDIVFHSWQQNFLTILILISFFIIIYTFFVKRSLKIILVVTWAIVLLLNVIFNGAFWEPEKTYFTFTSPDEKHILIVEECSWLLRGWSNFYEKTNNNFVKRLEVGIGTDDGYRPFSNNDYRIEWEENRAIIEYGFGSGNIKKQAIIEFP